MKLREKVSISACIIASGLFSPVMAANTVEEPLLNYSMVAGSQLVLTISNVDMSEISDVKLDGVSILELMQDLVNNGDIIFFANKDNDYFLKIKSQDLSESLMGKRFTVIMKSGVEFSYPKGKYGNVERIGNPEVDIYGRVQHCVSNPDYTGKFWQTPSYYENLKGAKVSATMGGQYDLDYTSSNGRYHLGYSAGHCKNDFEVKAIHPSTGKYKTSNASVWCWGYDSDDVVNFKFANEYTNSQGWDKCGEH